MKSYHLPGQSKLEFYCRKLIDFPYSRTILLAAAEYPVFRTPAICTIALLPGAFHVSCHSHLHHPSFSINPSSPMVSVDRPLAVNASPHPGPRNLPRASHACERCRAKKAKCDQCQPCSRCVRHAAQCYYGISKRGLRPRQPRQPRQVQQVEVTTASAEAASSVPSIGELPEGSPQEISNGDEIGDVNERTHGMEFYGTSSNHVLLNQLFSFVRNNRRHGQLRNSAMNPVVPSHNETEVGDSSADRCQGHQSSERPSAVNLLSTEEPLFPPSRRDTPPPTSQSRETQGSFNRANPNVGSQSASNPSLRLASSNLDVSSHVPSPSRIGSDGNHLTATKHRFERELVRSYLHNLHYLHPMLDGTEFVLQCEAEVWSWDVNAKKSAQRRHFTALFNVVVAVGALVAGREVAEEFSQEIIAIEQSKHQKPVSPQQISLRSLSRSYFQEARASLGDVFEVCSLESAQTLLLMVSTTLRLGKSIRPLTYSQSLYCQNMLKPHACYMHCGMAVRTALAIGLPTVAMESSPRDRRAARRTWW
jgi:hypothetical protein